MHQGFSQDGFHVARGLLAANPGSRLGAPQMTAVVHEGDPFMFEWRRPDTGRLERTEVRPGAIHVNAGHRPFYQRWSGGQRVLVMAFDSALVDEVGSAFGGMTDADIETVIGVRDVEIEGVANRLRRELGHDGPSGRVVVEAMAKLLLVHLFRTYSHAPGFASHVKGGLDPQRLARVLNFIDANITHEIKLSLLADVAGLSAHHFSSSFKAATGVPPYRFLLRRRLERAMEYLATTDRTIADIAHELGFPSHAHMSTHFKRILGVQPSSFAEAHVRRLEAIRKLTGSVERNPDGSWIVAPDHVDRAIAFEARRAKAAPVIVDTLSSTPLERQIGADGATWLDRELVATSPEPTQDAGFGAEVIAARIRRQQWLLDQGLAQEDQGRVVYRANLLTALRQRELRRVAGQLSDELGLGYAETRVGERIDGVYRRPVELASGRYALIEKSREFTLVPWRPVLEGHAGEPVSGVLRDGGVSWTIGRGRGGPSVS